MTDEQFEELRAYIQAHSMPTFLGEGDTLHIGVPPICKVVVREVDEITYDGDRIYLSRTDYADFQRRIH